MFVGSDEPRSTSERFSLISIREYCVAVSTSASWIGNLAVSKFVPVAIANIGWWMFIIFFFFNLINLVFAIVFIKETKKVSLEMMDEVFGKKKGC